MNRTEEAVQAYTKAIADYHVIDRVDAPEQNPYTEGSWAHLFYHKCFIDTVQWHWEDLARDPAVGTTRMVEIKRTIDRLNQQRTDCVEAMDDRFLWEHKHVTVSPEATLNTESPAWAFDRLSILCLKIYHMKVEAERVDASVEHQKNCRAKEQVLQIQLTDLMRAIEHLLQNIASGHVQMKVYRQMKMYNDPALNPVLYQTKA